MSKNSATAVNNKPDTSTAMVQLIDQVREAIPFNTPAEQLCAGPCTGCPKKLMEYLDSELEDGEYRLDNAETPSLGDVRKLGKTSQKIYNVLKKNNLIVDAAS